MELVHDVLVRKGTDVHTISAAASVLDAVCLMNEHRIGSLVVVRDGCVEGIFTERDVLQRVVAD